MQYPFFVLLDDARSQKGTLYEHLVQVDTYPAGALNGLQNQLQENWSKGWHAIVWAHYALGRDLMGLDKVDTEQTQLLIYWFSNKTLLANEESSQAWLSTQAQHEDSTGHKVPAGLAQVSLAQDRDSYIDTIEQIREDIAAGLIYQINYTTQFNLKAYGSPYALYQKIREQQRVPYGALAHLPYSLSTDLAHNLPQASAPSQAQSKTPNETPHQASFAKTMPSQASWTLCFSPELFLDIRQDGTIHTEPMKGTVPTADDGLNEERAEALRADPKNRAENVMIVDLLRNDLSKVAVPKGVTVPELFKVTNFGSVLQMTTPIQAEAKTGTTVEDILLALFPCGSITGAPKKMSMQLIDKYESRPRGLYTGSIGFLEPSDSGLGFYGKLNVVIRTLELQEDNHLEFTGRMGVGSGIVYDSQAAEEYEECHWKARFLRNLPWDFSLFETMRVEMVVGIAQCSLLESHIARLKRSALDLGGRFDEDKVRTTVLEHLKQLEREVLGKEQQVYRLKVTLHGDGSLELQSAPLDAIPHSSSANTKAQQTLIIAESKLANYDILRRHKTTHRQTFDTEMHRAIAQGAFDSLCFNQDGYLLEGARSSIFAHIDGQWLTPSLDLDILHSVMRAQIVQNPDRWLRPYTPMTTRPITVHEGLITLEQLQGAEQILAVNALRGIVPVKLAY